MRLPGSSSVSSAFPIRRIGSASRFVSANTIFRGLGFEAAAISLCSSLTVCSPPRSLLPLRVTLAGQPRLLHPSRTCVVTFARIGHATRPTTGNWRDEDFHLARFTVLSAAHLLAQHANRGSLRRGWIETPVLWNTSSNTPERIRNRTFDPSKPCVPLQCLFRFTCGRPCEADSAAPGLPSKRP